jgi:hypothetical protein
MGEDLITIDEHPTENSFVGAPEERENGETYGIVTTIRFWSCNDTSSADGSKGTAEPYNQIASMTFPHGPKNRVSAIGISKDGSVACTVSHNEKAFRVWQKQKSHREASDPSSDPEFQPQIWVCRYKVSIPSGFSNFSTGKNGVSFSEDSSILAISFGQFVTLWDADDARLLTSFYHCFGKSDIDRVQFVNPGLRRDLLLIQSAGGVTLRSLYGGQNGCSASFDAWTFAPRQTGKNRAIVTATKLIESHACIAISLYSPSKNQSSVVLIDSQTGSTGIRPIGSVNGIDGCILALCSSGMKWQGHTVQNVSNDEGDDSADNNDESKNKKPSAVSLLSLYALTNVGNLFLFREDPSAHLPNATATATTTIYSSEANENMYESNGPRLDMASEYYKDGRKRQRTTSYSYEGDEDVDMAAGVAADDDDDTMSSVKKLALDVFGYGITEKGTTGPPTAELPSLSGNFVKSFVGRNLSIRKKQ